MVNTKKTSLKKETKSKIVKKTENSGMMLSIYDLSGAVMKSVELPKEIFSVKNNEQVLAQYVRVYQANQRQGNASTKTRGEVTGSTRKIYRQKGTGKARHGSIKAPIFVGGGVVGGPKPRDYSLKMNKKQKRQALFASLSLRFNDKKIFGFSINAASLKPQTKLIVEFLKKLQINRKVVLCVLPKIEKNNFVLASRNIEGVSLKDVMSLNAFEILKAQAILIHEEALPLLSSHFK